MSIKMKNFLFITITVLVVAIAISVFVFTVPRHLANEVNKQDQVAIEWRCKENGEQVGYQFEDKKLISGKLYITIKKQNSKPSEKAVSKIFIDDGVRTSAFPVEIRTCGIYYEKLSNHNPDKVKQPPGFRSELFVSDYSGWKKKYWCFMKTKMVITHTTPQNLI